MSSTELGQLGRASGSLTEGRRPGPFHCCPLGRVCPASKSADFHFRKQTGAVHRPGAVDSNTPRFQSEVIPRPS